MRQGFSTPGGLSELPKIFRRQKSLHYPQARRELILRLIAKEGYSDRNLIINSLAYGITSFQTLRFIRDKPSQSHHQYF
jgi:hypothetical protein